VPQSDDDLAAAVAYAQRGRALAYDHDERAAIECYRAAIGPAERARAAVGTDDHARFVIYLHDMLGVLALGQSRLDEAELHFTSAWHLSQWLEPGGSDEAKFLNNLGSVARARGDQRAALTWYRRALELAGRMDPVPDAVGAYLSDIGTVLLALGELDYALGFFHRALAVDERVDPVAAATDRSLIASVLIEYGDLEQAGQHYEAALAIHSRHDPNSFDTARDLVNLGYAQRLSGDLGAALRHYLQALDIDQRIAPDSAEFAADLNNIGMIYRLRGDLERCREYWRRAVEISRHISPLSQRTAVRLNNLADLDRRAGRRAEARAGFMEALRIDEAVAPGSLETARDLNNLAALAVEERDYDTARGYARRALDICLRSAPRASGAAIGYGHLAWIAREQGDHDAAIEWTRAALAIDQGQAPRSEATATDLVNLAVLYADAGDQERAIHHYDQAASIVESIRLRAGLPLAREEVFALHQQPFTGLVRALLARGAPGDAERAFAVAERARGRALADLMEERRLRVAARTDEQRDLLAEEQHVEARLHRGRQRAAERYGPGANEADEHELAERLERVRLRIRDKFPAYAQLREPVPLDLTAAQALLDDATLLMAFHVDGDLCTTWIVQPGRCRMTPVAATADRLRGLVDEVMRACKTAGPWLYRVPGITELSRLLLAAVPSSWLDEAQQIVVVPSGPLAYLPFEMLPYGDGCLGDRLPVSYVPSVTVWADLRVRAGTRPATWSERVFAGFGLAGAGLPGTREVVEIAADYGDGGSAWTGEDLTKQLIQRECQGYRVVHFATHGVFDDQDPLSSGLSVASGETLRAVEMFRLPLDTQVVVCSACETAVGHLRAGEGLVGMSRALFYAGARSLVVSLWPVADLPTRRLMRRLHQNLRDGDTPAVALWRAKKRVRRSHPRVYAHPRQWAGFVLLGDGAATAADRPGCQQ
jgi:tetratricopeptide (TPR) repeat protein